MIPCELDITSTPFGDTTIITYKIELPPYGKKVGFNLLDDEDFKIPYITDTIPNSSAGHQLPSQTNINVEKSLSHLKVCLMNSIAIKLHVENTRSISVYAEGRATKQHILKRFAPDLIKSDL